MMPWRGSRTRARDLEDARADLAEARDSLAELESETGIWIPAGELIFLERLPVRVDLLTAERGSSVSGAFMTVTGSDLAVRGSVAVRDVTLVKEGGEARLDDTLLPEPLGRGDPLGGGPSGYQGGGQRSPLSRDRGGRKYRTN